jgi:hypothetical protein
MSDTGHPRNFGYAQCLWCGTWRPLPALTSDGTCAVWSVCCSVLKPTQTTGWDANGAPTGVDANGDAT